MTSYRGSKESPPGNVMENVVGKQVGSPVVSGLGYSCCAGMALFLASRATLTGGGWATGPLAAWHSGLQTSGITGSVAMAGVFSVPTAPLMQSSLSLLQAEGRESQTSVLSNKMKVDQSSPKGQQLQPWRHRGNAHRRFFQRALACEVSGCSLVQLVRGGLRCAGARDEGGSVCSSSSRGCRGRAGRGLGLSDGGPWLPGVKGALSFGICEWGSVWLGSGLGLRLGMHKVAGTVLNNPVGNVICLAGGLVLTLAGPVGDLGDGVEKKMRKAKDGGGGTEGGEGGSDSVPKRRSSSPNKPDLLRRRRWTNVLLGMNILAFVIQVASRGRLLLWGAKVNSLIEAGQIWRLITPAVLHANVGHLLVNCYSLNSVGPVVEELGGARRFLAVYTVSALTGTLASYRMCTSPSVGASGAIFGLVGALAVFFARHRRLLGNSGSQNLQSISRVIVLNMLLGVASGGVDNWGHVGGLLGGAATAWVIGPALVFQTPRGGGRRRLVDRPPYKLLFRSNDSTAS